MAASKQVILFGANCGKCKKIEKRIKNVVAQHQLDIDFEKTEDIEIMSEHNVMLLPSIWVDGTLHFKGITPTEKELLSVLKQ